VAEPPAVNASPLIFLARAGRIDLLRVAADALIVPAAVANELQRRGPADSAVRALNETRWLGVVATPPVPPIIQAWDLDDGRNQPHRPQGSPAVAV